MAHCRERVRYRFPYVDAPLSSPQPGTSTALRCRGYGLMYHAMCLFTPQLSLVLISHTHGRMAQAELTGVAGSAPGGLPTLKRSPIQAQTGSDVE